MAAAEPIRWSRLEPRARDESLAAGLEARVHDPLWLLARQWQFGELSAGPDLGSAVLAEVVTDVAPFTGYRAGKPGDGAAADPYDPTAEPLEVRVEAEDVRAAPTGRARARAGLHFERLLAEHRVERYAPDYRDAYGLEPAVDPGDAATGRFFAVIGGRVPDGARLYEDLSSALRAGGATPPALPPAPAIDDADVDAVRAAAQEWLAWCDALYAQPPSAGAAWVGDRMEYAFGLAAAGVALEAEEHADGRVDWHAFDPAPLAGPTQAVRVDGPAAVVPTPVDYPGMPAPRLWEFEDANVSFGDVQANPEDLGRMLLTSFALVYGGDWLLVPLEVPAGSLVRVRSLVVHDTFGQRVRIRPSAAVDGPRADWRMFTLSPAGGNGSAPADGLVVAPTLVSALRGRDLEEVLLLRDETANLAWAVERTVEGEHGQPVDRAQAAYAGRPDPEVPSAGDGFSYRLLTDVPEHWLPLIPRRSRPDDPAMAFTLGALERVLPDGTVEPTAPLGRVLSGGELVLREEEVPREGARVTRGYRLARWVDGSTFLWLARGKQVGRGEGSSGLRFDAM